MNYYSLKKDVLLIHKALEDWFDKINQPVSPKGIKTKAGLDSAIARPFQSAFDEFIYKSSIERGAALFHGVISSHPFHSGNKRMALLSTLAFLEQEGLALKHLSDNQLFEMTIALAGHKLAETSVMEVDTLTKWLVQKCSSTPKIIITQASIFNLINERQVLLKRLAET